MARLVERLAAQGSSAAPKTARARATWIPVALATPSLAISCAAREALHQADVVETMLRGLVTVLRDNDLVLWPNSLREHGRHGGRVVLGHQVLPDADIA